jgi:hypothetical protein
MLRVAVAVALAVASFVVIPEGDLLLPLPFSPTYNKLSS